MAHFTQKSNHVGRCFKAETGVRLDVYMESMKALHAMKLLNDPHVQIKDVHGECGCKHPPSFTRAFKRATGMTPTEYCALNREEQADDN